MLIQNRKDANPFQPCFLFNSYEAKSMPGFQSPRPEKGGVIRYCRAEEFVYLGVLFISKECIQQKSNRRIVGGVQVSRGFTHKQGTHGAGNQQADCSCGCSVVNFGSACSGKKGTEPKGKGLYSGHELWVGAERMRLQLLVARMTILCRISALSLESRIRSSVI